MSVKNNARHRHLFGPVASRRLGRSLGVDMAPAKLCSFDCIYCESGATTHATLERREYFPTRSVLRELDEYLRDAPRLDTITFSGAGEPTLHSGIGRVIEHLKRCHSGYSVALLTNATLLPDPALRHELRHVDLLIPSLDAADEAVMQAINRPVSGVSVAAMIDGLAAFRRDYAVRMWLEIFIVPGMNDAEEHLARLREAALRIAPERVQLNTLDRPGTEAWVKPATRVQLERIALRFKPLEVEIIARNHAVTAIADEGVPDDLTRRIMALVIRRPSTASDLAAGLGVGPEAVDRELSQMRDRGMLVTEERERGLFFRPAACAADAPEMRG